MCGITGFLSFQPESADLLGEVCGRMTDSLRHRGPDDSGVRVDPEAGIALGHRRLSILDTSPHGRQPMVSASGRYVISYNGEVYNYRAIRKELEVEGSGTQFRGNSDTEVILEAISAWGLRNAVKKFIGMFAFALWDRGDRVLYLVRDRIGIKPLYYGWAGQDLVFGSELKALRAHPRFSPEIDRASLALYLRHNYIPGPGSIYKGVFKLTPGHILALDASDGSRPRNGALRSEAYWSVRRVWEEGAENPWSGDEEEAADELESILTDAVKLRMISDVPLGAFLSGGIDSSTVVALMQSVSGIPVRTFSMGFHEEGFNEAPHAAEVAEHLGTDHTELYLTQEDARNVIPDLPVMYDEPFADASQIPTFLVSRLARDHVTVALSGDGGDELFSGYSRYSTTEEYRRYLRRFASYPASTVLRAVRRIPEPLLDLLCLPLNPVAMLLGRPPGRLGRRLRRLADTAGEGCFTHVYRQLISSVPRPTEHLLDAEDPETIFSRSRELEEKFDRFHLMSYLDLETYLPDDILVKVDRASMAVSLEVRVPILDHRIIEFAAHIGSDLKRRNGIGKWLLRKVLKRFLPEEMFDRPKMGFGIPVDSWLRGPLREWAEELISEARLRSEGYFVPRRVRRVWEDHACGREDGIHYLWTVLMFQAWLEKQ